MRLEGLRGSWVEEMELMFSLATLLIRVSVAFGQESISEDSQSL
jgi:hypothetical protein